MNILPSCYRTSTRTGALLPALLGCLVLCLVSLSSCSAAPSSGPADFSSVVEATMPSLVKIDNESMMPHPAFGDTAEQGEVPEVSEGTGFFIDGDGLIMTNYHVVDGAESLKVETFDRKTYTAELVGGDAFTDVALIRIKPDFKVKPAVLGDSSKLKVGQWVIALGNPLGLEFFATAGIVSGVGPPGPGYIGFYDFIQVDVNIKPGNSGGPLLNPAGEVVGINNAYMGPGTGIGFAIPINRAKEVVSALKTKGSVSRGFLGVVSQPLTKGLAERFKLPGTKGALVSDVLDGSPADLAGLKEGDVVLEWDGKPVESERDFGERIYGSPAGASVTLKVVRDGTAMTVSAVLGELKAHSLISERVIRQCGLTLKEVPKAMAEKMGIKDATGLMVLKVVPGCPAYDGGLRFGDVIRKVEGRDIRTVEGFYRAYSQMKEGSQVLVQVIRGGQPLFLTIKQGERQ